ncbi:MAG: ATP-binding protein [Saccharospirillaceae bacterium]|jgi:two-component system sensor histidine kinase FlrB|nr:PAS domain-containing sensor histidine kinase [Thalassolituus sp. HI0120]MCH2041573.1 ATP-binding protein [Saccharospirillaceae bacterium]
MANAALRQDTDVIPLGEPQLDRAELKQAFTLFNQMSQQLTDSYAFLEDKVEQLSGELANVSAQRMHELAEKEQLADRLESLLQLLPAGVLVLDENGFVTQANPAADDLLLKSSKKASLIGQRWVHLIQQCFKPQSDDGHEISLVDGRKVNLRIAAMANDCGQLIALTDMTETRALQSQLSQHERLSAMGKMVASLAHQIRTPLAAATLYAGHLGSDTLQPDMRVRFAGKLQERLQHLENQVRDMLIFARGEAPLNDEISVDELIEGLNSAMEIQLQQFQASCTIDNQATGSLFVCNKDALISSLMNLVNNSLESGEYPIEILIRITRCRQGLHIQVMDNGSGLNESQKQQMMEPFYTTKSNGTGLGLAVVQAVVHAHKGEFRLADSELGGLSAELSIPVVRGLHA